MFVCSEFASLSFLSQAVAYNVVQQMGIVKLEHRTLYKLMLLYSSISQNIIPFDFFVVYFDIVKKNHRYSYNFQRNM